MSYFFELDKYMGYKHVYSLDMFNDKTFGNILEGFHKYGIKKIITGYAGKEMIKKFYPMMANITHLNEEFDPMGADEIINPILEDAHRLSSRIFELITEDDFPIKVVPLNPNLQYKLYATI